MLLGGSRVFCTMICSSSSSTCFLGWICPIRQILRAQPPTTAGEELDGPSVDDLSVDDLSVHDHLSVRGAEC